MKKFFLQTMNKVKLVEQIQAMRFITLLVYNVLSIFGLLLYICQGPKVERIASKVRSRMIATIPYNVFLWCLCHFNPPTPSSILPHHLELLYTPYSTNKAT